MLLDAAQPGLQIADNHPVTDHRGMLFDHRAAQADDLLAEFLAHHDQV